MCVCECIYDGFKNLKFLIADSMSPKNGLFIFILFSIFRLTDFVIYLRNFDSRQSFPHSTHNKYRRFCG